MAIEKKDRSFDHIFDEVTFERVPMDYVETLKVHLVDGSILSMTQEDIKGAKTEMELLEGIDREDISDVAITLDYDSIKADVSATVEEVLRSFFEEK